MVATGAYLWALREAMGLSRDEVAYEANTNGVQVMRIEKGEIDTRGSLLLSIVKTVKGNAEHVAQLLLGDFTAEDGRRLAEQWLSGSEIKQAETLAAEIRNQGKVAEALEIIRRLEALDPAALDRLLSYGQGLLDRGT